MEPSTLAYFAASFGAFVMAANQYLSKADRFTERFPFFKPQGWWNYIPLPCFILAGLIWLFSPSSGPESSRDVTVSGLPLGVVERAFENRTDAEAKRIIWAYAGRKVTVTGMVLDVSVTELAVVDRRFASVVLDDQKIMPIFHLTFEEDAVETVISIRRGERISARCVFDAKSTGAGSIVFDDCHLIDGPYPSES